MGPQPMCMSLRAVVEAQAPRAASSYGMLGEGVEGWGLCWMGGCGCGGRGHPAAHVMRTRVHTHTTQPHGLKYVRTLTNST